MNRVTLVLTAVIALAVSTRLCPASPAADTDPSPAQPADATQPADASQSTASPSPTAPCKYWIGVHGHDVPAALRAHLKLPAGGVIVERVLPGGPAARAGLKPHDIVVAADGKPIAGADRLCEVIRRSGGEPFTLTIVRSGEQTSVVVDPDPRPPRRASTDAPLPRSLDPDMACVLEWLQKVHPPRRPGPTEIPRRMRLHFIHPGLILPPGADVAPALPPNMRISVSKRGDRPAEIVVQRGDERWQVTEDRLDDLPDDVRPHVDRMLGRLPLAAPGRPLLKVVPPGEAKSPDNRPDSGDGKSSSADGAGKNGETELFLPAPSVERVPGG